MPGTQHFRAKPGRAAGAPTPEFRRPVSAHCGRGLQALTGETRTFLLGRPGLPEPEGKRVAEGGRERQSVLGGERRIPRPSATFAFAAGFAPSRQAAKTNAEETRSFFTSTAHLPPLNFRPPRSVVPRALPDDAT